MKSENFPVKLSKRLESSFLGRPRLMKGNLTVKKFVRGTNGINRKHFIEI